MIQAPESQDEAREPGPMAQLMAALEAVSQALEQEAAAIVGGEPEALMQAVSAKSRALRHLEGLTREPWVRDLLSAPPGSRDGRRRELAERLERCQRQNLATGSAIVMARRDNELLLRALGYEPRGASYTARGDTTRAASARALGKA